MCQSTDPESLVKLVALSVYIMTSYIVTQRNSEKIALVL